MARTLLGNLIVLLVAATSGCALPLGAALFDELAPLSPDSSIYRGGEHFASDTPRGVFVGVHVLVTGLPPSSSVDWEVSNAPGLQAYRLIAVPVEQNTGVKGRTERHDGKRNRAVIRRAPFDVYDPFEPTSSPTPTDELGSLALRLELFVPRDAPAGSETSVIVLRCGEWEQALFWERRTHEATVPVSHNPPQPPEVEWRGFTNWLTVPQISLRHDVKLWSDGFWEILGRHADLMVRSHQDTFRVNWYHFIRAPKKEGGSMRVRKARFRQYCDAFLERGFRRVEGAPLAHRHEDDWDSERLDLYRDDIDVESEEAREYLEEFLGHVQELLATLPPDVEVLQHLADEPTDTNAQAYVALSEVVREFLPDVPLFEATLSREVVGAVDVWCPLVSRYQTHQEFFEERRDAGDRLWVYSCVVPGGKWLNRLLDQERLRPVYLAWALVRYDLEGYLHWGWNAYRDVDPYEQSVVGNGDSETSFLPAGDTHIVYPTADGLLSSQRLEAHRIGFEDAYLLDLLMQHKPGEAGQILDRVVQSFDDYETDPVMYRRAKRSLLEAVSSLPESPVPAVTD